jgi:hypothetical protein
MGVMESDSAVQAIFGTRLEKLKKEGKSPDDSLVAEMDKVRETYDRDSAPNTPLLAVWSMRSSRPRTSATHRYFRFRRL